MCKIKNIRIITCITYTQRAPGQVQRDTMHGSTKQNTVFPTQTEDPREADRQPDTATLFSDIDKYTDNDYQICEIQYGSLYYIKRVKHVLWFNAQLTLQETGAVVRVILAFYPKNVTKSQFLKSLTLRRTLILSQKTMKKKIIITSLLRLHKLK